MAVGGEHLGLGPASDLVVLEDIPQNSFAAKPISMVHGVVRGPAFRPSRTATERSDAAPDA
ncbi:hypothetical protein ABID95_001029 [Streptomyces atratus]